MSQYNKNEWDDLGDLIRENKEKRENNQKISLTLEGTIFDLEDNMGIPAIIKGDNVLIFSSTSVGKSKLFRFLIKVLQDITKRDNLKLKVFYNTLEETKSKIKTTFIQAYLYQRYDIELDYYTILGYKQNYISDNDLEKIEEAIEYYKIYFKDIILVSEPDIQKFESLVLNYAKEKGTFFDRRGNTTKSIHDADTYIPYDENEFVVVGTDHIKLYDNLPKKNKYQSLSYYSAKTCVQKFNMLCGYITINVMQSAPASTQKQFTYKGLSIKEKLEPRLDHISQNKSIADEATIVICPFDPYSNNITEYAGHTTYPLFRTLHILKQREGEKNVVIPVEMNPITGTFKLV